MMWNFMQKMQDEPITNTLPELVEAVIKAGATTVNIPDTTGYCLPHQYGEKIAYLVNHVPNIDKAVLSPVIAIMTSDWPLPIRLPVS